nr:hypothetical protein Iba_chr04aCG16240 [Ipomoea batatas]
MGRTKELAKKRKFDRGSSSRDPEEAILGTRALKLNAIQLAKRGDIYALVIFEFLATLQLKKEKNHNKPSISFTIFNRKFDISVNDLGWYLGIYTRDEMGIHRFHDYWTNFYSDREATEY